MIRKSRESSLARHEPESAFSVKELRPGTLYYEPELEIDPSKQYPDFKLKQIPHCISLRLLHYYGPFRNDDDNCEIQILIANCVHDSRKNVLICFRLDSEECQLVTDDFINRTFTLKNFATINCLEEISFSLADVECHSLQNKFVFISLIVSNEYNSILRFYRDELQQQQQGINEIYDDADSTLGDDNGNGAELELMEFVETNVSDNNKEENISEGKVSDTYFTEDDSASTLSPEETVNFLNIPSTSRVNRFFSTPKRQPLQQQQQPETNLRDRASNPVEILLAQLDKSLVEYFPVRYFIENSLSLIERFRSIELTPLAKLSEKYPRVTTDGYRFANVMGIVTKVSLSSTQLSEILIEDQNTDRISVKLGNASLELIRNNPFIDDCLFKRKLAKYKQILCGNVVSIRNLCLSINNANYCANPDQITIIKLQNCAETVDNKLISEQEFKQLVSLACIQSNKLALPSISSSSDFANFVGQFIGKLGGSNSRSAQVFMLMATNQHPSCQISSDCAELLYRQISQASVIVPDFGRYSSEFFKRLIERNHVITVTVYQSHLKLFQSLLPFDLVALYNVHVKPDRLFAGKKLYVLHDGDSYGRNCALLAHNSIIGCRALKTIETVLKSEITVFQAPFPPDLSDHVTPSRVDLPENKSKQNGEDHDQNTVNKEDGEDASNNDERERFVIFEDNIFVDTRKLEQRMLRASINWDQVHKIESFDELVNEDCSLQQRFYRVNARLVDYNIEDQNGVPFCDATAFRENFLRISCTSKRCHFVGTFLALLPKFSRMIASKDSNQPLECPECQSPLSIVVMILLCLEDRNQNWLTLLLKSPESERLIDCSIRQLIEVSPISVNIYRAFQFAFQSFCPQRNQELLKSLIDPNFQNIAQPDLGPVSKPQIDWIIESVKVNKNHKCFLKYPQLRNHRLFNLPTSSSGHSPNENSFKNRIFILREIIRISD